MKAYRNLYVRDYDKFPYAKLSGVDVLNYTGKIICYKGKPLPAQFDSKKDLLFDCDCEFTQWRRLNKVYL